MPKHAKYGQAVYNQAVYGVGITAVVPAEASHYQARGPRRLKQTWPQRYVLVKKGKPE